MSDVLEHPVVATLRSLSQAAAAAEASGDDPRVQAIRDQMVAAVHRVAEAVSDLREVALVQTVVVHAREETMRRSLGKMLTMQMALWHALQYFPVAHGSMAPVRAGLLDVMDQLGEVLEMCLFKLHVPLASTLQQRLASIASSPEVPGDWRETLAGL